jgi:hypothetical protein
MALLVFFWFYLHPLSFFSTFEVTNSIFHETRTFAEGIAHGGTPVAHRL